MNAALEAYRKKRDFTKTPEPSAQGSEMPSDGFFVVQKHDARNLHYDFRFALDGVLKSWAIPKGPSLDPADKRLAIETEDHPLDYANFEGTIPKGAYGGGTVLLWDRGKFEPESDPRKGLKAGKLKFRLDGEKLRGAFELVRTSPAKQKSQWLFFKRKDTYAGDRDGSITLRRPESIATRRSLGEIAADAGAAETAAGLLDFLRGQPQARTAGKPPEVTPQLATLATEVPAGEQWLHEIKWDGYRFLAEKHAGQVRLWTRQRKDWTKKFPAIAEAVARLPVDSFLLDGELVALDSHGRSDFQQLQNVLRRGKEARLAYYCFDLLYAEGFDLRKLPLERRKEALLQVFRGTKKKAGSVRYGDHLEGNGKRFYEHACQIGLEGIIPKRRDSAYVSARTRNWLKIKCTRRQEFVVCGFTPPTGSRRHFGSLALAVREDESWRYVGQVGTGFDQDALKELHGRLLPLRRKTSALPAKDTRSAPAEITWTTPQIIVEVSYAEVTESGRLRHPSFQGIREDKKPTDVVRERAVKTGTGTGRHQGRKNHSKKSAQKMKHPEADLSFPPSGEVSGVRISHPDREIYPDAAITKGELAVYYARVAERLLPHLARRPLSLLRCPSGAQKQCFFQKHFRASVPPFVGLIDISEKKGKEPYSYVSDARGISALAQYGVLEFHPWGSRIDKLERPDILIFDLDPDEGVSWQALLDATFTLKAFLAELGLISFLKVSGGKGLHVCLPIDRRTGWEEARGFCRQVAFRLSEREPERWVAQASKTKRKGKVFLDYLRNGRGATAVVPYSARARRGAPVALPIAWEEATPELRPNDWNLRQAVARIENLPDPWEDFFKTRQSLTKDMFAAVQTS